ncbi:uncharacterized protein LOC101852909 isoform X1 [Aplysia californica]|uniref:Uncharacterized protein LOC101852909 isoform X1 n=1 Tax=Aplysia californica TaxID=6500 RepID=A0ABM0JHK7_APLCA|nr:uncharacterized protein LOC101852909 isoform X1 [Aplysia californica]
MIKMSRAHNSLLPPVKVLCHVCKIALLCLLVVSILFSEVACGTGENKKSSAQPRRDRRSVGQQIPDRSLNDIIDQYESDNGDVDLLQYTPTTPRPQDVNCFVEVPATQRVGGRCVPLGASMGCQAGVYLAFNSECQNLADAQSASRDVTTVQDFTRQRRRGPSRRRRLRQLRRRTFSRRRDS